MTEDWYSSMLSEQGLENEEAEELFGVLYGELRSLARHYLSGEKANHTLQPTALVHEAYARLIEKNDHLWRDRNHFFVTAARTMRRVLVDHARKARASKRGEEAIHITLEDERHQPNREFALESVDEALKELAKLDARQCKIVELRFFAGLSIKECAEILQVSERTVNNDWQMARAWLYGKIKTEQDV